MSEVKTFSEVFDEIKAAVKTTKTGKQQKSFSRSDFNKLTKAYLNTPGLAIQKAVAKGDDEYEVQEIFPVLEFRKMLQVILKDFGVDKQESEKILTDAYQIRNADSMYDLLSGVLYSYLDAGKKFDFHTLPDFKGSISLLEMAETVTEQRNIQTGETFKMNKKQHKVVKTQSKAPKWLKTRV